MGKIDPIPWDFAVTVPGLARMQLVAAAWSGRRKAGVATLRLHNFPVWTVLGSSSFSGELGDN